MGLIELCFLQMGHFYILPYHTMDAENASIFMLEMYIAFGGCFMDKRGESSIF